MYHNIFEAAGILRQLDEQNNLFSQKQERQHNPCIQHTTNT